MTYWFRLLAVLFIFAASTPLRAAEPLVPAAWVKENYATEGVVFLDTRHISSFRQAAIPGAINTNYGKDGWRIKKGDLPGMLPPVDKLEKLIGRLGISNADHVVVVAGGYGASEMGVATRIYWTFKVLGHDQVSILDGGMEAYFGLGKVPLSRNIPRPQQKTFIAVQNGISSPRTRMSRRPILPVSPSSTTGRTTSFSASTRALRSNATAPSPAPVAFPANGLQSMTAACSASRTP